LLSVLLVLQTPLSLPLRYSQVAMLGLSKSLMHFVETNEIGFSQILFLRLIDKGAHR
jgi:hypothetical protein